MDKLFIDDDDLIDGEIDDELDEVLRISKNNIEQFKTEGTLFFDE